MIAGTVCADGQSSLTIIDYWHTRRDFHQHWSVIKYCYTASPALGTTSQQANLMLASSIQRL